MPRPEPGFAAGRARPAAVLALAVALAVHAAVFTGTVATVSPAGVAAIAWQLLYLSGVGVLCGAAGWSRARLPARVWASVLLHALGLAAIFYGADAALTILGHSVKPRTGPPAFLGGLTLPAFLVPGVTSVATGALAGIGVQARARRGWRRAAVPPQGGRRTADLTGDTMGVVPTTEETPR